MVKFIDDLETTFDRLTNRSREALTKTEKIYSKLKKSSKYDSNTLVYPTGQGEDSQNLLGHYIKFQVWEVAGLKDIDGKNRGKVVSGIDQIDGQPVKENASKVTRNTAGIGDIPMRQKESIILYMPEGISTSYGADWDLGEIGVATGKTLQTASNISSKTDTVDKLKEGFSSSKEIISSLLNKEAFIDLGISLTQTLNQSDTIRNTISAGTRTTRSPHLDFLFRSINTRQFNFEFRFNPFSEDEARITKEIIKSFKKNMHPKLKTLNGSDKAKVSTLGIFYQYPNVYKISFHSHGKENEWMHKMAVCALTNMEVNYTASGTSSFLRDTDNKGSPPADVNVTLSFIELEILSRDNIEEGF